MSLKALLVHDFRKDQFQESSTGRGAVLKTIREHMAAVSFDVASAPAARPCGHSFQRIDAHGVGCSRHLCQLGCRAPKFCRELCRGRCSV